MATGIFDFVIDETPIAVIDFETTGLSAGADRVVEVSIVRLEPGKEPELAFDTLVNPVRPMAATEIHGITDEAVADAPRFSDIAGEVLKATHGCVLAAYNVYFDMGFLAYELRSARIEHEPPFFCVMNLRPMLGLGPKCRLAVACSRHGIEHVGQHIAANDAMASAKLLKRFLEFANRNQIRTYKDLAKRGRYRFIQSFANDPFPHPRSFHLPPFDRIRSRVGIGRPTILDPARDAIAAYRSEIDALFDEPVITAEQIERVILMRNELGLSMDQVRSIHARVFVRFLAQVSHDRTIGAEDAEILRRARQVLSQLGWAPGD